MKHTPLIFILLLMLHFNSFSQISKEGKPKSFSSAMKKEIHTITTPAIDVKKLLAEDEKEQRENKDAPFRFGCPIQVNYSLDNSGTWEELENGDRVWRLKIYSQEAYSLNLIYSDFFMPEDATFFVYSEDKSTVLGAFTKENNSEHRKFSTSPTVGETCILEYYEPLKVHGQGHLQISTIVHAYKNVFGENQKENILEKVNGFGGSASCNINVNCPQGYPWYKQKRSVAMVLRYNGSRLCSGALVNNTSQNVTPYFLTAFHCVDIDGNKVISAADISDAQTWIFMFNYESPNCSNINGPTNQTISGATFISAYQPSDFALLKLNNTPPLSYDVFYAGWSAVDIVPSSSAAIHHPRGDIKKISFENNPAVSSSYPNCPANSHWEVRWDAGMVEHGSSGSPLFDQNQRIIGQLHGVAFSYCTDVNKWTYSGKFSSSWNGGGTPSTRLKDWLDPLNTGTLILDGRYPATPSVWVGGPFGYYTAVVNNAPSTPWYSWYYMQLDDETSSTSLLTSQQPPISDVAPRGYWYSIGGNTKSINFSTSPSYLKVEVSFTNGQSAISPIVYVYDNTPAKENLTMVVPKEYTISQNYPNPFNPETEIQYALPQSSNVKIIVYDVLGKEISTLVNEKQEKGYHTTKWNAKNVSSGTYFYKMMAIGENGETFTKIMKMGVIK